MLSRGLRYALCWVRPAGEIMVGRFAFGEATETENPGRFSLAVEPRYSDEPVLVLDRLCRQRGCQRRRGHRGCLGQGDIGVGDE
jgi:hypothetical protein